MANTNEQHGDDHGHAPSHPSVEVIHHPPIGLYHTTFLALLFLLIVTVVLYYLDFSAATHWVGTNLIIAMLVAVIKAVLVIRNFMNVRGATKLALFWAVLGFVWLIFMFGIFLDYQNRPNPIGWQQLTH
jgi:cytochrome c oxidase subunit IV